RRQRAPRQCRPARGLADRRPRRVRLRRPFPARFAGADGRQDLSRLRPAPASAKNHRPPPRSSPMRRLPRFIAGLVLAAALAAPASAQDKGDLENMLYMETAHGRVVIKLRPDLAPNHVARVKELARQKFYD